MSFMVQYKSTPENFSKEYNGLKPNTVRRYEPDDARIRTLKEYLPWENDGYIMISLANEPRTFFIRRIVDVTFWEDLVIISWVHQ